MNTGQRTQWGRGGGGGRREKRLTETRAQLYVTINLCQLLHPLSYLHTGVHFLNEFVVHSVTYLVLEREREREREKHHTPTPRATKNAVHKRLQKSKQTQTKGWE